MHYWYDISADMKCSDFAPWFLMYNDGELNSFGFSNFGKLDDPNVEPVRKGGLRVSPSYLRLENSISGSRLLSLLVIDNGYTVDVKICDE